ncbi:MAG: hypothetical protein ACQEXB_08695 [Bacillota bacterium]
MSTHVKSELALFSELLLSLLVIACLAVYCFKTFETFPWHSFIGVPVGISLIVTCWGQKKNDWNLFLVGLLINSLVWFIVLTVASL